jgi:hypothetical protein
MGDAVLMSLLSPLLARSLLPREHIVVDFHSGMSLFGDFSGTKNHQHHLISYQNCSPDKTKQNKHHPTKEKKRHEERQPQSVTKRENEVNHPFCIISRDLHQKHNLHFFFSMFNYTHP